MVSPRPGPATQKASTSCTLFLALLITSAVVPTFASAAAGRHARRARVLLADGSTAAAARKLAVQHDCTACPLTRQPVCSESGLELQNACLARCQGIIATEERCHGRSSINARVSGTAAQRRRQQGSAAIVDDAATRLTESEFSVGKSSMQRFRGEGFVMIAVRPPSDFGSGAKPAVSDRRFMQEGSAFNPLPTPLLTVSPPGLANRGVPDNAADPSEVTEYRITSDGQAFAKKLTGAEMAAYRSQRGRTSAGSDASRGAASEGSTPAAAPAAAPAKRRELEAVATVATQHAASHQEDREVDHQQVQEEESEYAAGINDVYVEEEVYDDGAEGEGENDAQEARAAGLQERRRQLSWVIPSRDDRIEETTDVYPGRASGRFTYRNPLDGLFYWCSGTLISNNAVLLAAHCVVNVVRSPVLWMDTFSFAPGARSGINPYGTATVKFVQYTSLYTNSTPGNDLAVAILNTQPGDLTGWLGYGYDCLAQVLQVNTSGFPSDKITGTRWRTNCTTDNVNPCNLNATTGLINRCDIMGGQSGAAIFSSSSTGPRARFVVAYEAKNITTQWNGAAVINQNTFSFIDNLVKLYKVNSPPPPPPRPPPPPAVKKGRRSLRQSLRALLRR
ncbi:hypothetical protein CHLRE_16g661500v5 [Chlamydomonas reinhardtii]|uniref:Peptidase S1 domain-containing protein n=1 Tax=Chlamydomonas reinhardtii TaxID=3055 RepID=A0A2K3CTJ8_CHLRE|nr:uncharacterized protein CHLRE_16g661500v5 [Chlamydomonas reinhardtii]PNW71610.1 hypothetical protein CHLRE_16g661500v5 [Chlamydomonas reinhardtii]